MSLHLKCASSLILDPDHSQCSAHIMLLPAFEAGSDLFAGYTVLSAVVSQYAAQWYMLQKLDFGTLQRIACFEKE